MINVSNEFKEQLNNGNKKYYQYAEVTLKNGTVLNLTNKNFWQGGVSVEGAVSTDNKFDIGSAIVNKAVLTINNIYEEFSEYIFEGASVVLQIGMALDETESPVIEKMRKGEFAVNEAKYNGSIITLECLDNMRKFDRKYSESKLKYPATLGQIVRDACSICGVTLQTVEFPHYDYIIQTRPSDEAVTFREILSWCAQIAGCFCRCDNYGRLELKWYNQSALENPEANKEKIHRIVSHYSSPIVSQDDVVITGVRVVEKKSDENSQEVLTTYQSGTDGYVISVEGNELIKDGVGETVVGWLGEQLIGLRFRKAEINHSSDPTIEEGDVAILADRKGNEYKILISSTTFSTGGSQNTKSSAESPARNSADRFSESTKNYVYWRNDLKKEKTEREKALEELADRLSKSSGVFTTIETDSAGGKIFYLHNKPKLSESDIVWKMTAEAWAVSTDGGKTWNGGMTVDGDTIVRILTATGINADWINTGAITVKDDDQNVIFSVDIDTGIVSIDGNHIYIGEQTLPEVVDKSKSIVLSLSDYYKSIQVDKDGNYESFPKDIQTSATVRYGNTDITNECSFSVAKSQYVEGKWDNTTKTYTVTALGADTGWVDITATYLNRFSDKQRFNVAKLYDSSGITYQLETPVSTIGYDGEYSVKQLELSAYSFDGKNRKPYAGRFVIKEDSGNGGFKTVYQSSVDESSVTHHLYSGISDSDGNVIKTSDNNFFQIKRDIKEIEVTLYVSGGTTQIIDRKVISVVEQQKPLTREDVFNLLTNNGEWKGIYKEGNELYISFTYAKGGKLVLGGKGNDNGELEIQDSNGEKVGGVDSSGVVASSGEIGGWDITKNGIYSKEKSIDGNPMTKIEDTGKIESLSKTNDLAHARMYDGKISAHSQSGSYAEMDGKIWLSDSETGTHKVELVGDGQVICESISSWYGGNIYVNNPIKIGNTIYNADSIELYGGTPYIDFHSGNSPADYTSRIIDEGYHLVFNSGSFSFNNKIMVDTISSYSKDIINLNALLKSEPVKSNVLGGGASAIGISGSGNLGVMPSSSKRYKHAIKLISEEDLNPEKLLDVNVVQYKYNDDYIGKEESDKIVPGFIAEEIDKKYPVAATYLNGQVEDWNYRYIIPPMLKLIQNLYKKIDDMQTKNNGTKI